MVCCQGEAGTDKAFVQGKIPGNPGNPRLQLIDSEHVQLGSVLYGTFMTGFPSSTPGFLGLRWESKNQLIKPESVRDAVFITPAA